MPLAPEILAPIAEDRPGGVDLRYDPLYDKIKEARRQDDDLPQGAWETERKVADWPLVIKLASDALATKTKDLQLAAWLTEALLRREGASGLRQGLVLLRELVTQFWDSLYPEIEDDDPEMRAGPLEWVGERLEVPVRQLALTRAGHSFFTYQDSRALGYEADVGSDYEKKKARAARVAEGAITPEEFDKGVDETPKAFYKALVAELSACRVELAALEAATDERFGHVAPGYKPLRVAIDDVDRVAKTLLAKKLETDPDPIEETPAEEGDGGAIDAASLADATTAGGGTRGTLAAMPTSRDDALGRIIGAARFLRRERATDPAPYLMLRGLRWGELRAEPGPRGAPAPALLLAPPTADRARLKTLLLDEKWSDLLDGVEELMALPHGRAWLDAQRYALVACAALGEDYDRVARGVRGALRQLLADFPGLPRAALLDDSPAANAETLAWLEHEGLTRGLGADLAEPTHASSNGTSAGSARGALERARAELAAGRPEQGLELVMRELARERSPRGRYLRRVDVATLMVEGGLASVAQPILEEVLDLVEQHKLEQWEEGGVVAAPMVLMCRAIDALNGDQSARQKLYLRICRLDPVAALAIRKS